MMKAKEVHKAAIDAAPSISEFEKMVLAVLIEERKLNKGLESKV